MDQLKNYFSNRSTLLNLSLSVFILYGVAVLHWSPARIIAFYWLDVSVFLFFFLLFMKWIGRLLWYFEIIWGYFVIMMLMLAALNLIIGVSDGLGFNQKLIDTACKRCDQSFEKIEALFFPFYDVSVYIILSALANLHLVTKLRRLSIPAFSENFLEFNVVYSIFIIPGFIFLAVLLTVFSGITLKTSSIICFLFFRFLLDYWQQKQVRSLESLAAATGKTL